MTLFWIVYSSAGTHTRSSSAGLPSSVASTVRAAPPRPRASA